MSLPDTLITRRLILQVVRVAVGEYLVPLDCHLGGVERVVIFGIEIIGVISRVDSLHVLAESLKGFHMPLRVGERETNFREAMVGLEPGKDESVVLECGGQLRGSLRLNGCVDSTVECVVSLLYKRAHGGVGEHIGRVTALGENLTHGTVEHITVERNAPDLAGGERQQVVVIERADGEVEKAVMVYFFLL